MVRHRVALAAMLLAMPTAAFAGWAPTATTSDRLASRGARLLGAYAFTQPQPFTDVRSNQWISVEVTFWVLEGKVFKCHDVSSGYRGCVVASEAEGN